MRYGEESTYSETTESVNYVINSPENIAIFLHHNFNSFHRYWSCRHCGNGLRSGPNDRGRSWWNYSKMLKLNPGYEPGVVRVAKMFGLYYSRISELINQVWIYLRRYHLRGNRTKSWISKPEKDPNFVQNYRPIALGSGLGKVFERILIEKDDAGPWKHPAAQLLWVT